MFEIFLLMTSVILNIFLIVENFSIRKKCKQLEEIEASAVLQQGQMPTLKYMCIGNGGSSSFIGSDINELKSNKKQLVFIRTQ
jgi:hypothetical protein